MCVCECVFSKGLSKVDPERARGKHFKGKSRGTRRQDVVKEEPAAA